MIGAELLLGELVDTNANRLAKALREIGVNLYYKTTVGDNAARITDVLNLALDRSEVVITSGGIGPTVDDMTRQAVADATGRELVYSKELEREIAARFRSFGRRMADNNRKQAYIPDGATPLSNPVGTAPCFLSEDVRGRGCVISLPGVPRELQHMLDNTVMPLLVERMGGAQVTRVRVLRTCAVGESNVDQAIGDLMEEANPTVGLAAHAGQTDVRIAARADTEAEAETLIDGMEARVRERLGIAVYGVGDESVAEVVGRLLEARELKLGVVDTLSGGLLVRELEEANYGALVATGLQPSGLEAAMSELGLAEGIPEEGDGRRELVVSMAGRIAPPEGLGLAMLGPFGDRRTYMALHTAEGVDLFERTRNYQEGEYVQRWLVTQGLDWIRRAVLGEPHSPVDWDFEE